MTSYIVRRILLGVPTTLVVLTLVFFLMRVAPGDPAISALGEYASEETIAGFRARMGLDAPLWQQYVGYLGGFLRGDLGRSLISEQPVGPAIWSVLPYTLVLVMSATLIGFTVGTALGILSAINRNKIFDDVTRIISLVGVSVPDFYLGVLLLLGLAVEIPLFPIHGGGDPTQPLDYLRHLVLPACALGVISLAYLTRVTRSAMLEVMSQDYIRTAKSKGLPARLVLYKHAFRNVLVEVITVVGMLLVLSIAGSVMLEFVFSRPGLGRMLVTAANQRDYTTMQSLMSIYAIIIVVGNLLTDISYGFFDPRIRYD